MRHSGQYAVVIIPAIFLFAVFTASAAQKKTIALPSPRAVVDAVVAQLRADTTTARQASLGAVEEKSATWWIGADGLSYFVTPTVDITVRLSIGAIETYPKPPADAALPKHMTALVTKFLKAQRFVIDRKNSSKNERDESLYDYIRAFTKKNIFCVMSHNNDLYALKADDPLETDWSLSCFTKAAFKKARKEQRPFLLALAKKDRTDVIVGPRVQGNFAVVTVNARRGGYYTIMKKTKGKWVALYAGQDVPPCTTMQQHKVPESVYGECI